MKKLIKRNKRKFKKKELILLLLIFLILVLITFLLFFCSKKRTKDSERHPAVLQAESKPGVLLMAPSDGNATVDVGSSLDLDITLDTGALEATGVDVLLEYDPQLFGVTAISPTAQGTTSFKTFAPVNSDPVPSFDYLQAVKEAESIIEFSAITFDLDPNGDNNPEDGVPTLAFNGTTLLASVTLQAKPVRSDTFAPIYFRAQEDATDDSNIAVIEPEVLDILGTTNHAALKIRAEPVCRAALDVSDQSPGLNDLLYIMPQWNQTCSSCLEDLDENGTVGLGDLLYVTGYWGQTCPVSP